MITPPALAERWRDALAVREERKARARRRREELAAPRKAGKAIAQAEKLRRTRAGDTKEESK